MFSQNSKPNRRAFLERSMLGFGSAFLLPSLLTSCTDHLIPDPKPNPNPQPGTKINPRLLGTNDVYWNDDAKAIVTSVLSLVPEVGLGLSGLVGLFWPSSNTNSQVVDVWGQVKDQVEDFFNQKIDALVYADVKTTLGVMCSSKPDFDPDDLDSNPRYDPSCLSKGLAGSVSTYLSYLKTGTPAEILTQWQITCNDFVNAIGKFQAANYQTQLLPLFAQFVNMYLAVLRDGALFGQSWGRTWNDTIVTAQLLKNTISSFTTYTNDVYTRYRDYLAINNTWNTVNRFDRLMTSQVLDYMDAWEYYDVTQYPDGVGGTPIEIFTREIFTDAMGTIDGLPSDFYFDNPLLLPTQIAPQSGQYFSSMQVTYSDRSTPRMGVDDDPNYLRTYTITPDNPIIQVETTYNIFVNTVRFRFDDGSLTETLGITEGSNYDNWSFNYMAVSSINIRDWGYDSAESRKYGDKNLAAAAFIIYGFRYWKAPQESLRAVRALYVTSPKEHSMADFAKVNPKLTTANVITEDLKKARKKYWASIHAGANRPK